MRFRVTVHSPSAVPDFVRYLENDFDAPEFCTSRPIPIHRYFAGSITLHQAFSSETSLAEQVFDFGSRVFVRRFNTSEWRPNLDNGSPIPPWLRVAYGELGVKEVRGKKHNPRVLEYHSTTGKAKTDEVPWCASFVNWCLLQAGYQGTGSAWSLSFLNWKSGYTLPEPVYGCIAVIDNGNSRGHVGFVVGTARSNTSQYVLLGGNQSDSVRLSHERRAVSRFLLPVNHTPHVLDNVLFKQPTRGPALTFRNTR